MSSKTRGACWQKDPSLCRLHGYASAAHTAEAKVELEVAESRYLDSDNGEELDEEAFTAYRKARVAYYATPEGQRKLQADIAKLQGTPFVEKMSTLMGLRDEANMWVDNFEKMNEALKNSSNSKFNPVTGAKRTLPLPPAVEDNDWSSVRVLSDFTIDDHSASFVWDSKQGLLVYSESDNVEAGRVLGKFFTEAEAVKAAEIYYNDRLIPRSDL